jgi:predicted nucleic acid-binding Zn ribbon protein
VPIFVFACAKDCGEERETIQSGSAPAPEHCGAPMKKIPQLAGSAFVTKGGNWFHRSTTTGPVYKGGGHAKPKVIGVGHGVGGKRRNPTMLRDLASRTGQTETLKAQEATIAALAKKRKTT